MPRTEHNTDDEIVYPHSFGVRRVQDRSRRLRKQAQIIFMLSISSIFVQDYVKVPSENRLGYATVY